VIFFKAVLLASAKGAGINPDYSRSNV